MLEADLYKPVKTYLERQGYKVKGEVNHCDVVGVRDADVVIVELKLSLNLTSLLQCIDRLAMTEMVYVGVPHTTKVLTSKRKEIAKLFRRLGMGLISINPDNRAAPIAVLFDPVPYQPRIDKKRRGRLLSEFERRVGDPNEGGSASSKGMVTAYRQRALRIADHLSGYGATKASIVALETSDPKARNILYDDVYGWFERHGNGVYDLSPRGVREVPEWLKRTAI